VKSRNVLLLCFNEEYLVCSDVVFIVKMAVQSLLHSS